VRSGITGDVEGTMDLSVIIPVRDEERNVTELVSRLVETIDTLAVEFEIIFVTDINTDRTYEVLGELHGQDARVKVIKFSNTFGQQAAVMAGLQFSSGEAVVIMDGDLQDMPEDIPKLYATMVQGYDVVYGEKRRKNDSPLRNIYSRLFVKVMSALSDYNIRYNTSMFRIVSRRAVNELLRFREYEPSLTFIMGLINFPTTSVEVTSGKRLKGRTKYGFFRQMNLAVGMLLAFSTKPLRLISICGFIVSILSFAYLIIVLVQSLFFGVSVLGWPTIITLITLLGGLQLFSMGIIGEYIGRVFLQSKQRPLYIIEEKLGEFR